MAISVWPFKNQCPLLPLHSNPPVMDPNLWGTQQHHHRSCRRLLVLPLLWSVSSQRFLSILTSASPTAASASADAPPPLSRDGQTSPPRSLPHSTPAPVPPPPPAPKSDSTSQFICIVVSSSLFIIYVRHTCLSHKFFLFLCPS